MTTQIATNEWRNTRLADVCDLNMGQSPDSKTYNGNGDGLPFFQGKTDFGFKHPTVRIYCSDPKKIVEAGDILMSVRAPVGPVNIADTKSCIGRGIARLRSKKDLLNQDFLYFDLILNEKKIASLGSGSTFDAINKSHLSDFELTIPSMQEQNSIAQTLTTIQNAIAEQENLIAKLKELKRSMMQHLFTHGTKGEKTKMTEVGEIPESWNTKKLGDLVQVTSGGTPSREKLEYWSGGTIPWVKTTEVNYFPITDTEEKITEIGLKNSSAKIFPKGTLLMAMYGQGVTRGRVAILNIDATTNQACAAFLGSEEVNQYLFYYFTYVYETVRQLGHGANQKNLNASLIKSMVIPIGDSAEMEKIVSSLEAVDTKIDVVQNQLQIYQHLFKTLLHELMSGERRIKLWITQ